MKNNDDDQDQRSIEIQSTSPEKSLNEILYGKYNESYRDASGKTQIESAIDEYDTLKALWMAESGAIVDSNLQHYFIKVIYMSLGRIACAIARPMNNDETVEKERIVLGKFIKYGLKEDADKFNKYLSTCSSYDDAAQGVLNYFTTIDLIPHKNSVLTVSLRDCAASDIINTLFEIGSSNFIYNLKLSKLVHNEVEKNLPNCTIHKFILFEHLKSIPNFFAQEDLIKINATVIKDFFTLLAICKPETEGKEWVNKDNALLELPLVPLNNIIQNIDLGDWLQIVGNVEDGWW